GGVMSASISRARSSSDRTPSARHMRSIEPKTFDATGISKPVGFSKSSAGPPSFDLQARSVTAAISRSGLTGSPMRARSLRASRSATKSERSEYIRITEKGPHPFPRVPGKREPAPFRQRLGSVVSDRDSIGDRIGLVADVVDPDAQRARADDARQLGARSGGGRRR